ncbi:MAG: hypothetical protein QOF60_197 [Actinomycetota bacterium]|jgi:hypothetical protein|nr:hypothetical protein [Actinomycetota bacterium]
MTTFAFCALVSPGVTTSILALSHVWPADHAITVVDCAPSGGTIGQRLALPLDRGLASLAARARTEILTGTVAAQELHRAGEVAVLCAPTSGRSVTAALARLGPQFATVLGELPGDVLIDCGRIWPGSPALPVVRAADRVILVSRATAVELERVAADGGPTLGGSSETGGGWARPDVTAPPATGVAPLCLRGC